METLHLYITTLATVLVCAIGTDGEDTKQQVDEDVGMMLSQVVDHNIIGCHLIILTTAEHSHLFSSILRHMSADVVAGVVVEAGWVLSQDQLTQDHLLQGLWGDSKTTCRAIILDVTESNNTNLALRLLESSGLWKMSETRVVIIGWTAGVKDVLLHHSLRNTVHGLYLALHDLAILTPPNHRDSRLRKVLPQEASNIEGVSVYRRCLYCNNGKADVQLIYHWNHTSPVQQAKDLFTEQFLNFMGHKFKIVTVSYFPYIAYKKDSESKGTTVTLTDSLDARLLDTFSHKLNFT
ncbi:uncharacterized protein LOC121867138 [Homarus americanus]|nr:uncharacterized protein LOC121867138 [Homarus americanus]